MQMAGQAAIRWNGRIYPVGRLEVLDAEPARAIFSSTQQAGMARFGIRTVLHVRHQASAPRLPGVLTF
jgi:hypothetical protein